MAQHGAVAAPISEELRTLKEKKHKKKEKNNKLKQDRGQTHAVSASHSLGNGAALGSSLRDGSGKPKKRKHVEHKQQPKDRGATGEVVYNGHSDGTAGGKPSDAPAKRKAATEGASKEEEEEEHEGEGLEMLQRKKVRREEKRVRKEARREAKQQQMLEQQGQQNGEDAGDQTTVELTQVHDEAPLWRESVKRSDVKVGRLSETERTTLRQAVQNYARLHEHSTTDLSWLFCKGQSHGKWKEIAKALPHRTVKSVWAAGWRMLHPGNYQGAWTEEEDTRLAAAVAELGHKWTKVGALLGRLPESCRDRWVEYGRLKGKRRDGRWSIEETTALAREVQAYLDAREKAPNSKRDAGGSGDSKRLVQDDIDWQVISDRLGGSRSAIQCLGKWYDQVAPSMVEAGEWSSSNDKELLAALLAVMGQVNYEYEVEWGDLVPGRCAEAARKRWRAMSKLIPGHSNMELPELVEMVAERYAPKLKEKVAAAIHA